MKHCFNYSLTFETMFHISFYKNTIYSKVV